MSVEHDKISRRVGIVGLLTFLSRIFGLLRDAILAWSFGATMAADAFYVAFRIPNLLRRLVAEGALTVAFIPVYTEYLKKSREEGRVAASVIFTYLSLFLAILSVVGIIFAPWIVKLVAWGFSSNPDKFSLTVYLTRLMFPYILFISLVALAMGILNSLKRFASPAAAPILLNLSIIFGAVVLKYFFALPVVGVALGVLLGGVLQLVLQIPFLIREGMLPRLNFNWRHSALGGILMLMIPSALGAAVYQINVLVITLLASFLPQGSISYLWYADRVSEFPLGIFAISVATVILPSLSDHAANRNMDALKETINFGMRFAFLIAVPAAVGLFILSNLSIGVLFERGMFVRSTAVATAGALSIFAIKIPFTAGVRNLVPAFFALRDARTPVYVSILAFTVNGVCALALMGRFLHFGLAAALVVASAVNFFALLFLLRKKIGAIGYRKIWRSLVKTIVASAIMGSCLRLAVIYAGIAPFGGSIFKRAGFLFSLIVVGVFIFVMSIKMKGGDEYGMLTATLSKRRRKRIIV